VRAGDGASVGQRDGHLVALSGHRLHPRLREHLHAAAGEHVLEHLRRVGVLARQYPVARGHQHDLDAERHVGAGELRTRHAGADDDQLGGRLVEVVDLFPGQDALAVRLGRRQRPRRRSGGEEHGIGVQGLGAPVRELDHDALGALEPATPPQHAHVLALQAPADVGGLVGGEGLDPLVDPAQVDRDLVRGVALVVLEAQPELGRHGEVRHQLRGRDQRLAGHAVGHHRRATQPVAVDHRHLGAELRRHQCRLVPARSPADDHDVVRLPDMRCGHAAIVSHVLRADPAP
jgi:hypothetical protein